MAASKKASWVAPALGGFFVGTCVLVVASAAALGATLVLEPDDYPSETALTRVMPGVTLSIHGRSELEVISLDRFGRPSTGTRYFGIGGPGGSEQAAFDLTVPFRADFELLANHVSIDFVGVLAFGVPTVGVLQAFDCSGQPIGQYTTRKLYRGDIETATVSSADDEIAYVIATIQACPDCSGTGLDHLVADVGATTCPPPTEVRGKSWGRLKLGYR